MAMGDGPAPRAERETALFRRDIRAVLFDLDGTLINQRTSLLGRITALLHVLAASQSGEHSAPSRWPAPARRLIVPAAWLAAAVERRLAPSVALAPDAHPLLRALDEQGLPYGVVTNGRARKRATLRLLGLERRTPCLFISGEQGRAKPEADLFHTASACLGLPPARILFVGDDHHQDIAGARAAGMATAWLRRRRRWPWHRGDPRADLSLATLSDLVSWLGRATFPRRGDETG